MVEIPFSWETIDFFTVRAKVFGGWLVNSFSGEYKTTIFVPDKNHEWKISK